MSPDHVIRGRAIIFWMIEYGCLHALEALVHAGAKVEGAEVEVEIPLLKHKQQRGKIPRTRGTQLVRTSPRSLRKQRQDAGKNGGRRLRNAKSNRGAPSESSVTSIKKSMSPLQYCHHWLHWAAEHRVAVEKGTARAHAGFACRHDGLHRIRELLQSRQQTLGSPTDDSNAATSSAVVTNVASVTKEKQSRKPQVVSGRTRKSSRSTPTGQAKFDERNTTLVGSDAAKHRRVRRGVHHEDRPTESALTLHERVTIASRTRRQIVDQVAAAQYYVDAELMSAQSTASRNVELSQRKADLIENAAQRKDVHMDVSSGMEAVCAFFETFIPTTLEI